MVRVVVLAVAFAIATFAGLAAPAAQPVLAADEPQRATARYVLEPERNAIAVQVDFDVVAADTEIAIEEIATNVRFEAEEGTIRGEIVSRGLGERTYGLRLTPSLEPGSAPRRIVLRYDLPGAPPRSIEFTRAGPAYAAFCVRPFGLGGQTTVTVPKSYRLRLWGDRMIRSLDGELVHYTSASIARPDWFACLGGFSRDGYQRDELTSPSGRPIVLESYPEDEEWRDAIRADLGTELRRVEELMGRRLPGSGTLIVREVPYSDIAGYAGTFEAREQLIRITEEYDQPGLVAHELSHAWFNDAMFENIWLMEGYAGWVEGQANDSGCRPTSDPPEGYVVDLDLWQFLSEVPAFEEIEMVDFQYAAACTVVREVMERAGDGGARAILEALLDHRNPYGADLEKLPAGNHGWRAWLDIVDEIGLHPAGERDLDFTTVRLARYGAGDEVEEILARRLARSMFHEATDGPGGWAVPAFIRLDLANWRFDDARAALLPAIAARDDALEVERLLPELSDVVASIRADWEASQDVADLNRVATTTDRLRRVTERVARARTLAGADTDPVEAFGLVGSDPGPLVDAAVASLRTGDLDAARERADSVIATVEESSRAGMLRAAASGLGVLVVFVAANVFWRRRSRRLQLAVAAATPALAGLGPARRADALPTPSGRVTVPRPVPATSATSATPGSAPRRRPALLAAGALTVVLAALAVVVTALVLRRRTRQTH